jgi:hypothetical protein
MDNKITRESTDKEILDFKIGTTTMREVGSLTFLGIIANKLNGLPTYAAATQELLMLVSNPPIGRMPEGEKIRIVRKLLELDVTL